MAVPVHHGCYGACEKEVFDAKNAKVVLPVGTPQGCPALTPAQITQIERDIEAQFKGERVTKPCTDPTTCECNYGAQPPWPAAYDTIDLDWEAEGTVGRKTCKYTFKAKVDTASVTVTGKCKRKPTAPSIKGKTKLAG